VIFHDLDMDRTDNSMSGQKSGTLRAVSEVVNDRDINTDYLSKPFKIEENYDDTANGNKEEETCELVRILPYEVLLLPRELPQDYWVSSFTLSDHRPLHATFKYVTKMLRRDKIL